jgi:hypothetical protein
MRIHQSNKALNNKGNRVKRQPTERERISASYTSDRGLITRIYKGHKKLNSQRINNPMNKWTNEWNGQFPI